MGEESEQVVLAATCNQSSRTGVSWVWAPEPVLSSLQNTYYSPGPWIYIRPQGFTSHGRQFWYQRCRVRITLLPPDGKFAQLAHILLGVSKSKTMRRLQDKGRGQPCPNPSPCSTVHPSLSWAQRHSNKQTNALTRTRGLRDLVLASRMQFTSQLGSGASSPNEARGRTSTSLWRSMRGSSEWTQSTGSSSVCFGYLSNYYFEKYTVGQVTQDQ